ncbi:MAG: DinB family protein [Anaerolineales bacterium]|nr:DinB family protein [Anaerolineales bacterium]
MKLTLLLDLDETLLQTNQDQFFPAYLRALTTSFAPEFDSEKTLSALTASIEKMIHSADASRTLKDIFSDEFCPQMGMTRQELDSHIDVFYSQVFPTLKHITAEIAETKPFVEWAAAQDFRLVVATDPLLPRPATRQRVEWAGLNPDQFELISTFEDFHFSKKSPAYYAELLGRLGWQEGPVLMAGNDKELDMLSAQRLGLTTFFVGAESGSAAESGRLSDLRRYIESANFQALIPSFKTEEAIRAILLSTPAVLDGLLRGLSAEQWKAKPFSNEWSLTELVCHLRDVEREIHQMQIALFGKGGEPFIPRPDTAIWAHRRGYLNDDGLAALREFSAARAATLSLLKSADWTRKARHAIFGPTDFREVVGFMAEHDRLHVQQAFSLLEKI